MSFRFWIVARLFLIVKFPLDTWLSISPKERSSTCSPPEAPAKSAARAAPASTMLNRQIKDIMRFISKTSRKM
jgi:hypothetical protein